MSYELVSPLFVYL